MIETVPHNDVRTDHAVPVRRLLSIGETRNYDPAEWPDYAAKFGLGREHVGRWNGILTRIGLSTPRSPPERFAYN
jgi:hypothetical protein